MILRKRRYYRVNPDRNPYLETLTILRRQKREIDDLSQETEDLKRQVSELTEELRKQGLTIKI
jgi:cell division protein FtsB